MTEATRIPAGADPEAESRSAAIDVERLTKTFRSGDEEVEALRGVTLHIPQGACAFIVGPSGSGKSTLLYLLGALDRPTSGTIRIGGRDLTAMSEDEQDDFRRNRIGFVYQSFNLIQNLSAVDNVLLPYIPTGLSPALRARAGELLKEVGLGNRQGHRPSQLSGGQQQRVAIARALVKDPLLILADEPTGNLDRAGGDEIIALLRARQQASRCTLVIVTHDRRFIRTGDLVLEIEDGHLKSSSDGQVTAEFPPNPELSRPR